MCTLGQYLEMQVVFSRASIFDHRADALIAKLMQLWYFYICQHVALLDVTCVKTGWYNIVLLLKSDDIFNLDKCIF